MNWLGSSVYDFSKQYMLIDLPDRNKRVLQ